MNTPFPALDAAVHAVRGESALDAVLPALDDWRLAHVIALAPGVHPVVQAIAALRGGLTTLLSPEDIASPALHDALARLIGTEIGRDVIGWWSWVAPAGWGAPHAAALRDAVQRRMCTPVAAAALLGPCDESARLLTTPDAIAFAIRHWGLAAPAAPTAWADALSDSERTRLIGAIRSDPYRIACCLPWLPTNAAHAADIPNDAIHNAMDAFVAASPIARTLRADLVRQIVGNARPWQIESLTHLAYVTGMDDAWTCVTMLLQEDMTATASVIAVAPWDDLPETVRAAILERAGRSTVGTAVAAARGRRDAAQTDITAETAAAFFAALAPAVWDALDAATQQRWLQAVQAWHMPLAIRSLGLRPEILARSDLTIDLIHAVRRHAQRDDALRTALQPVALRTVDRAMAHALIAAMPLPDDPGAFFCVASGQCDPSVIDRARATLRTPVDLALAVALQRSAHRNAWTRDECAALITALRGRTRDDLTPILELLDADARAVFMHAPGALAVQLTPPERRDRMHAVIDRLAALPPAVAIPTTGALHQWARRRTDASDAAVAITVALHAHGDLALDILDALEDDRRTALLPLPDAPPLRDAIRACIQDDPVIGWTLASALRDRRRRAVLLTLLAAPPRHADAVWQALEETEQRAIVDDLPAGTMTCAPLDGRDPVVALALAALQSGDPALRDAGITALAARPATLRAMWDTLPPEVRHVLRDSPAVAVAVADLGHPPPSPSAPTGRRRRILR